MKRFFCFLIINFSALAIGSLLMGNPTTNNWYLMQNKAPWTPPGWVFGAAWFTVMFCFSVFLSLASKKFSLPQLRFFYLLFALQFLLNVVWNPVFFRFHFVVAGLIIIISLLFLMCWFLWWGAKNMGKGAFWVLPYVAWLAVATSLNAYILVNN